MYCTHNGCCRSKVQPTKAIFFLTNDLFHLGVSCMAHFLVEKPDGPQVAFLDVDWPVFFRTFSSLRKSPRLEKIRNEESVIESKSKSAESLASQILLEKDIERQKEKVRGYIISIMKTWTGDLSSEIDQRSSLYNYGVDSSGALTFKMQLEATLQVSFEVHVENLTLFCFDIANLQLTY